MTIDLKLLRHRDAFGLFLTLHGFRGMGAEIGVAYAENAEKLLNDWAIGTLLLVDPYVQQDKTVYRDQTGRMNMQAAFEHARDRLKRFGDRAKFVREFSVVAAGRVPDESLDFAYIDGNHDYRNVSADIAAWWPKVRSGGILGGHDFYFMDTRDDLCEVPKAVDAFIEATKLPLRLTECSSWWIVKP